MKKIFISRYAILSLAFLEGTTVMAVELLSSKMIAPFFGTSLYTWSAVLAITLMALTAGYFIGAKLSDITFFFKKLSLLLGSAFIWILIMPFIGNELMNNFISIDYKVAVIISALVLISPPMILLGSVSPLLINILGNQESAGKASGTIYAVSTLGGVLCVFLLGFWLIPQLGISVSYLITSFFMLISIVILFSAKKKKISTF